MLKINLKNQLLYKLKKPQAVTPNSKPRVSRAVIILWRLTLGSVLAFVLFITLINYEVFGDMPSIQDLQNPSSIIASEVFADDGTPMGKYYLEDRSPVEMKDISKNVTNALIATEDERFYEHSGIDGRSLLRSAKGVVTLNQDGGGSTITQQLALNLFGGRREKNKLKRVFQKLKEWIIAVKLERNFTKDEIMTYYLNTVPFGDNVYGIRNAARTFFQKEPDRVNVEEAAVLVGMLKGNTKFNPRRDPKASLDRRNTVMDQMVRNDFLQSTECEKLKRSPIKLNYKKLDQNQGIAPYFRENVLKDEVKKLLKDKTKPNGKPYDIYRDGLKIYTTINPKMQLYGEEAVAKNVAEQQKFIYGANSQLRNGKIWNQYPIQLAKLIKQTDRWKHQEEDGMDSAANMQTFNVKVPMKVFAWNAKREKDTTMTPLDSVKYHRHFLQSGFIAMEPVSGNVKTWVGGIDYKTFKLDHAGQSTKRQVGSAIKPMLYCQALEEAGFTPETPCPNVPQNFPGFGLVPAKGSGARGGTYAMKDAIAYSLNGCAAYLMKQLGPKRFVDFLNTCNIQTKLEAYPSNALGSCEISLYEMIWMYSMFPGRGFNTRPQFVARIEDHNGNVIMQVQPQHKEVISEITSYLMCKMMTGCVKYGTGKRWSSFGIKAEVGAKTGTTQDNSDSWFMCYTPELLIGTWVGCDDRFIKTPGDGSRVALTACGTFLKSVLNDKKLGYDPEAKFIKPLVDKNEIISDYVEGIYAPPPPDAEGRNEGNGEANDYKDYGTEGDSTNIDELKGESEYIIEEPKKDPPVKPDTGKNKISSPADKPKAVMPGTLKPGDKPKTEPKKDNDYRR